MRDQRHFGGKINSHRHSVASGDGGQGGSCPPGPVESDKSSLWMDFSETYLMTIAENITSEPPNLKIFGEG